MMKRGSGATVTLLRLIHEQAGGIPVSEGTILKFHKLAHGQIWDAGKYKEKNIDIIQKYPDGRQRVRKEFTKGRF